MVWNCQFISTPAGYEDANDAQRDPKLPIKSMDAPFYLDWWKLF